LVELRLNAKSVEQLFGYEEVKMKVVINRQYGGFGLSHKAIMRYAELKGIKLWPVKTDNYENAHIAEDLTDKYLDYLTKPLNSDGTYKDEDFWTYYNIPRDDPALVQTVEELGEESYGRHATLKVVEIPDDVKWEIDDYDGMETIDEFHRSWC
jgi:hypothetical protein